MFEDLIINRKIIVAEISDPYERLNTVDITEPKIGNLANVYKKRKHLGWFLTVDNKTYFVIDATRDIMKVEDENGNVKTFVVLDDGRLFKLIKKYKLQLIVVSALERRVMTILAVRSDETLKSPVIEMVKSDIRFKNIFMYEREAEKTKELLNKIFEKAKRIYYNVSANLCNYALIEYLLGKEKVKLVRFRPNGEPVVF